MWRNDKDYINNIEMVSAKDMRLNFEKKFSVEAIIRNIENKIKENFDERQIDYFVRNNLEDVIEVLKKHGYEVEKYDFSDKVIVIGW